MNPCWVVKNVVPQEDYKLLLTFERGERKIFDCTPLLEYAINEKLKNRAFFMNASAMDGTVVWSNDIDIDPEYLYENATPINL